MPTESPGSAAPIDRKKLAPQAMIRVFRVFIPTSILGLLLSEVLLTAALFFAALNWQFDDGLFYLRYEDGWPQLIAVTATIILGLYLNDCYERVRMQSRLVFAQQLCLVIGVAFLVQALFSYAQLPVRMPRQSMLMGSISCLLLMPFWRTLYSRIALAVVGAERVLFVGAHPLQRQLAKRLDEHPEYAMQTLGFLVESPQSAETIKDHPVLGLVSDIEAVLRKRSFDRIIVGLADDVSLAGPLQELIRLRQAGYNIQDIGDAYEVVFGRVAISQLHPNQLLSRDGLQPSVLLLRLQAIYSFALALFGLILVSPVLILAALAVKLTSAGPILFRQTRTGQHNIPFTLYKLRSMYIDAEAHTGAVWATENDPRVTPVGRLLRQYRIDELPQLLNVLRGEMAIAGPRPERPEFIATLAEKIPYYMHRLAVKPGITGWAQINYRYGNTIEDTVVKLEYDLYYIKNFSPQLDLYIMFHTVKTMLLTRGAY